MIWGYAKKTLTEFGLLEMKEVTFHADPQFLRRIARFLESTADAVEAGTMRHSHLHLQDQDPAWRDDYPGKDVIVAMPLNLDAYPEAR